MRLKEDQGECSIKAIRVVQKHVYECINPGDDWPNYYAINLDNHTDFVFVVNADGEDSALDEVVDYIEKRGWTGYFADDEVNVLPKDDDADGYTIAGNHGHWLKNDNGLSIWKLPSIMDGHLTFDGYNAFDGYNEGWIR